MELVAQRRFLLFGTQSAATGSDLWVLPMAGDRKPFSFLVTPFNETLARLSPDARWVAYTSDESGLSQVYVAPFPGPGDRSMISGTGGHMPRWSGDGKQIFFLALDGTVMAVGVTATAWPSSSERHKGCSCRSPTGRRSITTTSRQTGSGSSWPRPTTTPVLRVHHGRAELAADEREVTRATRGGAQFCAPRGCTDPPLAGIRSRPAPAAGSL